MSVVLVGSTGDLAKRYLWPAIFHSYMERECLSSSECGLIVVGGSRRPVGEEEGDNVWRELLAGVHCETVSCELCLNKFANSSLRAKISEEDDYKNLSVTLSDAHRRLNHTEVGRVYYLSVPPSAYGSIVGHIHRHGRLSGATWLRVVLEKPFGRDLSSAELLAREVGRYLTEEEVFRVDHYLGKSGVQQIVPFRRANSARLQTLWSSAGIQHIQVCMKERLDVAGRSRFFDKYGIVRDVHQNHLTEVLARVLQDVEEDSDGEALLGDRVSFLSDLVPPSLQHSVLGQYEGYHTHLARDGVENLNSSTPTYATVVLHSRDPRWSGVPLILTAGKLLDERKAYARVLFKEWQFSLVWGDTSCPPEIIFLIQDEVIRKPGVLLSWHFWEMDLEGGRDLEWTRSRVAVGNCSYVFLSLSHESSSNAYVPLMADILKGRKEMFVDTEGLLAAWRVWDPLLEEIEMATDTLHMATYSPRDLTPLDFRLEASRLFSKTSEVISMVPCEEVVTGLGHVGVVGSRWHVISCLAEELQASALSSVAKRGAFHLALPGGQSPRTLLDILSLYHTHSLPWKHVHVWQTDERCVKCNHSDSNWNQIDNLLLSRVHVPFHQLHPMPVDLQSGVCAEEDDGCGLYERDLLQSTGGVALDHVILGVGSDGHVASLFPSESVAPPPHQPRPSEHVQLVQLRPTAASKMKSRMTLTYSTLLSARTLSLLIVGAGKREIAERVLAGDGGADMPLFKLLQDCREDQVKLYIVT